MYVTIGAPDRPCIGWILTLLRSLPSTSAQASVAQWHVFNLAWHVFNWHALPVCTYVSFCSNSNIAAEVKWQFGKLRSYNTFLSNLESSKVLIACNASFSIRYIHIYIHICQDQRTRSAMRRLGLMSVLRSLPSASAQASVDRS